MGGGGGCRFCRGLKKSMGGRKGNHKKKKKSRWIFGNFDFTCVFHFHLHFHFSFPFPFLFSFAICHNTSAIH